MRAAPPGTISGRINVSPLLPVMVTVPTCAPGSSGAHRSSSSAMSVCGAAVPFAHDDGVCTGEHRLHAVRFCKAYAHGRNDRVGRDGIERIVGKGKVEQRCCIGKSRLGALGVQYHGDILYAIALGACRQAVHGLLGITGFQAGRAGVGVDELVGVGKTEAAVAHGIHPNGGVFADARMASSARDMHAMSRAVV